jgi:hypothetical protein
MLPTNSFFPRLLAGPHAIARGIAKMRPYSKRIERSKHDEWPLPVWLPVGRVGHGR